MPSQIPTLHMVCGKIAAGKSTLVDRLASAPSTVLISEDHWMSCLYKDELQTVADYARYSKRLRNAIGGHIEALLKAGLSVALDFPANTLSTRQWMRSIFEGAGTAHCLHVLDVPDETCRARLKRRNAAGTHTFVVSDAEFDEITRHFVLPTVQEGFEMVFHRET